MKVLIADDDPISRKLLQSYLQKWGCEVTSAENGGEAWAFFQQGEFPIVITDWMMPELDGVELVRRIRSGPHSGYVYVILLTAKGQKEDLVAGMDAGADDFLTKPFDRDELRVRLRAGERIVELEQQARAAARLVGAAPELERQLAGVIEELRSLRRDVLAAASSTDDRIARRFDESLTELGRTCECVRKLSGRTNT
jgi:DNA-binding response OmpR family regulator